MKLIIEIDEQHFEILQIAVRNGMGDNSQKIIANGIPLIDVLDKIKGYIDHIRNTGMGKKKSLEFIEKFVEGLKAESEVNNG